MLVICERDVADPHIHEVMRMTTDAKFKLSPSDVEHVGKLGRHFVEVLALANEGQSSASISRVLSIPVRTVKYRLSRAQIAILKMRDGDRVISFRQARR